MNNLQLVKLEYFKQSGKYYSEGVYDTDKVISVEIIDEIKQMRYNGELPGLAHGCGQDFDIYVSSSIVGYPIVINALTKKDKFSHQLKKSINKMNLYESMIHNNDMLEKYNKTKEEAIALSTYFEGVVDGYRECQKFLED